MRRRGGLGRGLEALIPSTPQQEQVAEGAGTSVVTDLSKEWSAKEQSPMSPPYFEAPLDRIDPNPRQPREAFAEETLEELSDSIRAVGVLQPIVIRPVGDRFQIIMGERRVRAARLAGLTTIPAVVRITEDHHLLRDALIENVHREDLNPLEEAAAYAQLLSDFNVTQEELASRIGRSRPAISNALRLMGLPASVQRRIAAGTLSPGHARAVLQLSDPEQQERLADLIVAQGMTVRMAEELARRVQIGESLLDGETTRRRTRPVPQAPGMVDLAERLSDRLETRVRVQLGKRKGKVMIEFATLDDLRRICDAIGLNPDDVSKLAGDGQVPSPAV
jgi:ParB family chromosome partitioning protein